MYLHANKASLQTCTDNPQKHFQILCSLHWAAALMVTILFIGCGSPSGSIHPGNSKATGTPVNADYLAIMGDSVLIPSFSIQVNLSKTANEKLVHDKETIIVSALFSGSPKDTLSKEYREMGEMFITEARIELDSSRLATFAGIKFPKARYDSLADKDIRLLINIFSGRRAGPDNLLDCNILEEKMSAVKGRTFTLTGKLIYDTSSVKQ